MLFAPLLLGALVLSAPLAATDLETGKSLYREKCRDCHGSRGQSRALGKSKVLNRLETDEILAKLRAVQEGKAEEPPDVAKSDLSEDDIQFLGIYIRSLKRR